MQKRKVRITKVVAGFSGQSLGNSSCHNTRNALQGLNSHYY